MDISFALIPVALADSASNSVLDANGSYTASDIIRVGISLVVLVAGLCAILFIIWGGLMLILSGWKDEKVKPAINSIRYAVIGIIVIVIAIFVAPKVSEMLGLGTHDYLSPKSIFDTIQQLMWKIFGGGNSGGFTPSTSTIPSDFSDI
jgi:Type IV secretion system pilin